MSNLDKLYKDLDDLAAKYKSTGDMDTRIIYAGRLLEYGLLTGNVEMQRAARTLSKDTSQDRLQGARLVV